MKTYREITYEVVSKWFRPNVISICEQHHEILSAIVKLSDILPLQPSYFEEKELRELLLIRRQDNKAAHLLDILNENIFIQSIFDSMPNLNCYEKKTISIPGENYHFPHDSKLLRVHRVELMVGFRKTIKEIPISKVTAYGHNEISTEILEFENALPGEHPTIQLIKAEDRSIWLSRK